MSDVVFHGNICKLIEDLEASLFEPRELVSLRYLNAVPSDLEAMLAEIEAEELIA